MCRSVVPHLKVFYLGLKSKHQQGCAPFGASREKLFRFSFQLLEATHTPGLRLFLLLQSQQEKSSPRAAIILILPLPHIRTIVNAWNPHRSSRNYVPLQGLLIRNFNSTHNLNPLLPCNLIEDLAIRIWYLWWPLFCLPQHLSPYLCPGCQQLQRPLVLSSS